MSLMDCDRSVALCIEVYANSADGTDMSIDEAVAQALRCDAL